MPLSHPEAFLLRWLAREDTSALGECSGAVLEVLFERGLAGIVSPGPVNDYSRVAVTDAGWKVLDEIGRTDPRDVA